jgi:hypothetical protein
MLFSKFVWVFPTNRKDCVTVSKAFVKIIKSAESQKHKSPNLFHTDKGLEFENKYVSTLLNNFNIKVFHTQNEEKSAIIERFNRTLNNKMRILFEARNNKKWTDILQDLLDEYSFNDKHGSTGMTPSDVNKSNENVVLRTPFKQSNKERKHKIKFKVGDRVGMKRFKQNFGNKYNPNWTREIFFINHTSYNLEN